MPTFYTQRPALLLLWHIQIQNAFHRNRTLTGPTLLREIKSQTKYTQEPTALVQSTTSILQPVTRLSSAKFSATSLSKWQLRQNPNSGAICPCSLYHVQTIHRHVTKRRPTPHVEGCTPLKYHTRAPFPPPPGYDGHQLVEVRESFFSLIREKKPGENTPR